jgi:hypothetical protein
MRKLLAVLSLLIISAAAQSHQFYSVFPGVSVRTSFAYDYGEMFEAVTFEGQEYTAQEAAVVILPRFGWADTANRIRLGTLWANEVVLFGSELVDSQKLAATWLPLTEILPDGTFRYTVWTVSMRGRKPGSESTRWQVDINPEAQVRTTVLENVDDSTPLSPRLKP